MENRIIASDILAFLLSMLAWSLFIIMENIIEQ